MLHTETANRAPNHTSLHLSPSGLFLGFGVTSLAHRSNLRFVLVDNRRVGTGRARRARLSAMMVGLFLRSNLGINIFAGPRPPWYAGGMGKNTATPRSL